MDARLPQPSKKPRTAMIGALIVGALIACGVIAYFAAVALYTPVRSEVTEVDAEAPRPAPPAPEVETGIEAEASTVAEAIANANESWSPLVTGVEVVTVLRRPLVVVSTDVGPEQADLSDTLASELASFAGELRADDGVRYSYYIRILSADGEIVGGVSATDDRWALEAPPAPADARELQAWLAEVYGPASGSPEVWLERITSIEAGAADSGDSLLVRTNLDPGAVTDLQTAQTIIDAVNSSGAAFSSGIRVVFADGEFEWSAILTGVDPYGPR